MNPKYSFFPHAYAVPKDTFDVSEEYKYALWFDRLTDDPYGLVEEAGSKILSDLGIDHMIKICKIKHSHTTNSTSRRQCAYLISEPSFNYNKLILDQYGVSSEDDLFWVYRLERK